MGDRDEIKKAQIVTGTLRGETASRHRNKSCRQLQTMQSGQCGREQPFPELLESIAAETEPPVIFKANRKCFVNFKWESKHTRPCSSCNSHLSWEEKPQLAEGKRVKLESYS